MTLAYAVLVGVLNVVWALTTEERHAVRNSMLPDLIACGKEYRVTKEQASAARNSNNPDVLDPCFYACFFKKAGILTENGIFDPEGTVIKHKKMVTDKEYLEKLDVIGMHCSSVNNHPLEDGAKGCIRAKLLIHCFLEYKDMFRTYFT